MTHEEYQAALKAAGRTRGDRIRPAKRAGMVSGGRTHGAGTPHAGLNTDIRASSGTPGIAAPADSRDNRGQECRDAADAALWVARASGWNLLAHGKRSR